MTPPKVFLHIGEPKCGTTFLQEVLWLNQPLLERHGVRMPGAGVMDHYRAAQDLREVEQLSTDPAVRWAGTWRPAAKEARRAKRIGVISHEMIVGATDEQAARAVADLEPADVHVVLTARDFGSLLPAEWQETVKHGNARTWHQWLSDVIDAAPENRRPRAAWFWQAHDTPAVLERWARALTPQQVHLVTMPPPGSAPGLLWQRFAGVLGIGDLTLDFDGVRANASLGIVEAELLRRVNARLPDLPQWFYARHVKSSLAHGVLSQLPNSLKVTLPRPRHEWVRDYTAERIERIKGLGVDVVGDLSDLAVSDTLPTGPNPADLTDAQLLEAALDALATDIQLQYDNDNEPVALRRAFNFAGPELLGLPGLRRVRAAAWRFADAVRRRSG